VRQNQGPSGIYRAKKMQNIKFHWKIMRFISNRNVISCHQNENLNQKEPKKVETRLRLLHEKVKTEEMAYETLMTKHSSKMDFKQLLDQKFWAELKNMGVNYTGKFKYRDEFVKKWQLASSLQLRIQEAYLS
jgi:pimeloyl-CoA synthetase